MAFCRVVLRRAQHAILHGFESGFGKGPRIAQFGVSKKRRAGVALCDIWTRMGFSRMHAGAALPGEAGRGCTSGTILEAVGDGFSEGNGMAFEAVISAGWRGSFAGRGSKLHRWILARVREYGSRDVSSAFFFLVLGLRSWGLQSLAFWSSQGMEL